jgi:hypothetical protein
LTVAGVAWTSKANFAGPGWVAWNTLTLAALGKRTAAAASLASRLRMAVSWAIARRRSAAVGGGRLVVDQVFFPNFAWGVGQVIVRRILRLGVVGAGGLAYVFAREQRCYPTFLNVAETPAGEDRLQSGQDGFAIGSVVVGVGENHLAGIIVGKAAAGARAAGFLACIVEQAGIEAQGAHGGLRRVVAALDCGK